LRILYVTPRFPHPRQKGDQIVPYHRLRILGRSHEITLVSLYEHEEELAVIDEVRAFCAAVVPVRLSTWQTLARLPLSALASDRPLQILYYRSAAVERCLHELASENRFDIVHGYMLRTAPYLRLVPAPSVLDAMDAMQLRLTRNIAVEQLPKRWLLREELRRIKPYEQATGREVDAVVVVSSQDAPYFPGARVVTIPNGVDTEAFTPDGTSREPGLIVFSGTMSYPPNILAANWFVEHCLPLIRREVPGAQLLIAGSNPTSEIQALGKRQDVTVTGFVESMPAALTRASVAVAPMHSGAGIQNKILEAMACGLPVVTTTLGLGGIEAIADRELVVADDAQTFAREAARLLREPEHARRIGAAAREFVIRRHSWEEAGNRIDALYEEIADAGVRYDARRSSMNQDGAARS
jgi:polysaccharide biosynthesis protein PslH